MELKEKLATGSGTAGRSKANITLGRITSDWRAVVNKVPMLFVKGAIIHRL